MEKYSNAELLEACNWEVHKALDCDDLDCDCQDDFKCWKVAKFLPFGTEKCTEEQKNTSIGPVNF